MERYNHKSNLTHDQLVELRRAFEMLDTDKSGYLEAQELKSMLVGLGQGEVTDQEAEKLLEAADLDGDGRINFKEFCIASGGRGWVKANVDTTQRSSFPNVSRVEADHNGRKSIQSNMFQSEQEEDVI